MLQFLLLPSHGLLRRGASESKVAQGHRTGAWEGIERAFAASVLWPGRADLAPFSIAFQALGAEVTASAMAALSLRGLAVAAAAQPKDAPKLPENATQVPGVTRRVLRLL
jgi:hypothetical protein